MSSLKLFKKLDTWKVSSTSKIVRFYPGADLRASHTGLAALMKKDSLTPESLRAGEFIIFTNTKRNMIKMFGPNNTLVHFKLPYGGTIDLAVIKHLPQFLNGQELNYQGAVKKMLEERFK